MKPEFFALCRLWVYWVLKISIFAVLYTLSGTQDDFFYSSSRYFTVCHFLCITIYETYRVSSLSKVQQSYV